MTAIIPSLADMIADATVALHRLQIGQMAVRVKTADGYDTEFKAADINKLQEYLNGLLLQQAGVTSPQRGAIGFVFSIALALLVALSSGAQAAARAPAVDPDLPYSCFTVRLYAQLYSADQLEALAKRYGVVLSAKQRRQAQDCFR